MLKLRKPCEHGRYEEHRVRHPDDDSWWCPGGEFLADDAHAEFEMEGDDGTKRRYMIVALGPSDALTVREGA